MKNIKIGISIGDINGIGPEIVVKTLSDRRILRNATPVIYASSKFISEVASKIDRSSFQFNSIRDLSQIKPRVVNVLDCWKSAPSSKIGEATVDSGKAAKDSLEALTQDTIKGDIEAMVTAPINKKAMNMAGFQHVGHTEFLMHACDTDDVMMMLCSSEMKMALVTGHIPIQDVSTAITKKIIRAKILMLIDTLKIDFGVEKPRIAVLGMQPHAGDQGVIGKEDEEKTKPAIEEMKSKGHFVFGPYSSDAFFGNMQHTKFDAVLSCYHDQGLIPFKMSSFGKGVNVTCGLPIIRTSPDHGTAYEIAGSNKADAGSFRHAFFQAIDIARNRQQYHFDHSNPMRTSGKVAQDAEDITHD